MDRSDYNQYTLYVCTNSQRINKVLHFKTEKLKEA